VNVRKREKYRGALDIVQGVQFVLITSFAVFKRALQLRLSFSPLSSSCPFGGHNCLKTGRKYGSRAFNNGSQLFGGKRKKKRKNREREKEREKKKKRVEEEAEKGKDHTHTNKQTNKQTTNSKVNSQSEKKRKLIHTHRF